MNLLFGPIIKSVGAVGIQTILTLEVNGKY